MKNFVFPNVNPEFIGCGRYAASQQKPGSDYTELMSHILKQDQVEQAAVLLAPPPATVNKIVYEKKDQPEESYAGDSLQLAYLLTCISRYRDVKLPPAGDIWCTGRITLDAGQNSWLEPVGSKGFHKKLEAFLAPANSDRLFIVSTKNIKPRHHDLCQEFHATLMPLADFQVEATPKSPDDKIVLMVQPDELFRLISVVFALGPNPYKGLTSFQQQDAPLFFGREDLTQRIWDYYAGFQDTSSEELPEHRFLAILGPSGSGKSSVARAGFLARLKQNVPPEMKQPEVLICKPGTQPLRNLAEQLAYLRSSDRRDSEKINTFEQHMRQESKGLSQITKQLSDTPFVILIDQFEELYSLENSEQEQERFIENLLTAAADHNTSIFVIIVMRSDFLGQTKRHAELDNAIAHSNIIVPVMQRADIRRAIAEPAKRSGYPLDQETIDLLLDQTTGQNGALPLLEFALTQIWDGIAKGLPPEETLNRIGGVGGALAGKAEQMYQQLPDTHKPVAQRIFQTLVEIDEEKRSYVKRSAKISDLVSHLGDFDIVSDVLDRFSQPQARLMSLTSDTETGETLVEVTHNALFTYWKTLSSWLDNAFDDLRLKHRLTEAVERWEARHEPKGLLWRPPDLDELRMYHQQHHDNMTSLQVTFFKASESWHRLVKFLTRGGIIILILLTMLAGSGWFRATQSALRLQKQRNDIIRNLTRSARQLMDLHDGLGAMLSMVKAGRSVRDADVPVELQQFVVDTFRGIGLYAVETNRLQQHASPVFALSFNPDGTILASGGGDGTIRLVRAEDGMQLDKTFGGDLATVLSVAFNPQAPVLASAHLDSTVRLWNLQTGQQIQELKGHTGRINSVAFSPDGKFLASGGNDAAIQLWNTQSGTLQTTFQGHLDDVYSVTFSPDGKLLASASKDRTIKLWEIGSAKEIRTLEGHSGSVYYAAFSPDGKLLASAGQDKKIYLWNVTRDEPIDTFEGHTDQVYHVTFHPDGHTIASASQDNTITLWDVQNKKYRILRGHSEAVYQVHFSPDGETLASAGEDRTIRLWKASNNLSPSASLDELLTFSCQWMQGYLKTNPDISPEDRRACDDILHQM